MFSWLKERWLAQKAFKENDAHPVYGGLHRLLRNIVNDPGEGVYNLTIENKRKIWFFRFLSGSLTQGGPEAC